MTKRTVLFTKKILSNKSVSEIPSDFNNLAKTRSPIDEKEIFNYYNNVKQNIPTSGTNSHAKIVETSDDYINKSLYRSIKSQNKRLVDDLAVLENKLVLLQNPSIKEDSIYEDKAFLMIGDGNGRKHQDHNDIFVMQEGRRRKIDDPSGTIYKFIRRAWGKPEDYTGIYYLSLEEINNLKDGADITSTSDLLLEGRALEVDLPDILGISAYLDLELTCMGNEISDYVNAWTGVVDENSSYDESIQSNFENLNNLQFSLNNQACSIKYIVDEFYNDEVGPVVKSISIPADTTSTIRILREANSTNSNMPSNMNQYYDQYPIVNLSYGGNDITNYIREWGPGTKYPGIVHVSGRVKYKEVEDSLLHGSIPDGLGMPYDPTPYILNGLPTGDTGNWETDTNIALIDYDGYTGQELSAYGTKMLYNEPGLFGSLGQNSDIQDMFDDPNHRYYWKYYTYDGVDYPLYGQPIIRYDNTHWVLLFAYKSSGNRVRLYNIDSGGTEKYRKGQIEDWLDISYDAGIVYWNTLDKASRLKFPGLQGWKPNGNPNQDNPFNTAANGSNYG